MVCLCSAVSLADLNEGWIDDADDTNDDGVIYSVDDAYPQTYVGAVAATNGQRPTDSDQRTATNGVTSTSVSLPP